MIIWYWIIDSHILQHSNCLHLCFEGIAEKSVFWSNVSVHWPSVERFISCLGLGCSVKAALVIFRRAFARKSNKILLSAQTAALSVKPSFPGIFFLIPGQKQYQTTFPTTTKSEDFFLWRIVRLDLRIANLLYKIHIRHNTLQTSLYWNLFWNDYKS